MTRLLWPLAAAMIGHAHTAGVCGACEHNGHVSWEILFKRAMQRITWRLSAEFEDLNGGCPNVTVDTGFASRPSYLVPLNPSKDPWSWYQRTLTFQVSSALPCP